MSTNDNDNQSRGSSVYHIISLNLRADEEVGKPAALFYRMRILLDIFLFLVIPILVFLCFAKDQNKKNCIDEVFSSVLRYTLFSPFFFLL